MSEHKYDSPRAKRNVPQPRRSTGQSTVMSVHKMSAPKLLESIEKLRKTQGQEATDPSIAMLLGLVGEKFQEQGDYVQAIEYLNQALAIYLELGDKDREVVQVRNQLGLVYIAQRNFVYAESLFEQALEIAEENSVEHAETLYHIGLMRKAQQEYAMATASFNQAQGIYRILGKKTDVASMLYHSGTVYLAQNQHALAQTDFVRALAEFGEGDENNDEIADTLRHLGLAQLAQSNHAQALASFQQAFIKYTALNEKHYEIALTHYHIGSVHFAQNHYVEANFSFAQALTLFGEDSDCVEVAEVLYQQGLAQSTLGNQVIALEYWNKALTQYRSINESNRYNAKIELVLNRIGLAHQTQGHTDYAIGSFEQVLELYVDLPEGTAQPNVAATHRHIGEAHLAANNMLEARTSLLKAFKMYQTLGQQSETSAVQLLLNRTNQAPRVDRVASQAIQRGVLHTSGGSGSTGSNEYIAPQQSTLLAYLCSCCGLFGTSASKTTATQQKEAFKSGVGSGNPLTEHLNEDEVTAYGSTTGIGFGTNGDRK